MPSRHRSKKFNDFELDLGKTGRAYNTVVLSLAEQYGKVWFVADNLDDKEYTFTRRQIIDYSKYLLGECLRIMHEQGMGSGAAPRAIQKIKKRFHIIDNLENPDAE